MNMVRNFFTVTILLSPNLLYAQAITDGSMGAVQNLSGNFMVPETLGAVQGANLFHSFKSFSINSGESATFTGSSNILNVISRVTGGELSTFNGTLNSQVGKANFYFVNPAGIVFGSEAKIDVPAAFHASTVDGLHFADGSNYNVNTAANTLSISAPESFGLTTISAANNSLLSVNGATLNVKNTQILDLTAGEINISNAVISANEGAVRLTASKLNMNQANVSVNTNGAEDAGNVDIYATTMNLTDGTQITADSNGAGKGGRVSIHDADTLTVQKGSLLSSHSNETGDGGAVNINARTVNLNGNNLGDFTGIATNAMSTGDAGKINIQATSVNIEGGAEINSSTFGDGNANSVTLSVDDLTIDGKNTPFGATGLGSRANPSSSGHAGMVLVAATNSIKLLNGGQISSATSSSGNAGNVNVSANAMRIDGQNNQNTLTGIDSSTNASATGNAGIVNVNVHDLAIMNAGSIASNSSGSGRGGAVQIQTDTLNINGQGIASDVFTGISSNAFGQGNAGNVSVISSNISLFEKGRIASNAYQDSTGNAGNVSVVANHLTIDGNNSEVYTGIASNTYEGSKGNAGTINVQAAQIKIENAGRITSNTRGQGEAGNLTIEAEDIIIDAKNSLYLAGIASAASPTSTGKVGNIILTATHGINLSNAAQISIQNNAVVPNTDTLTFGKIEITTPALTLNSNSYINAQSTQNADASNINLHISNALEMHLSSISTRANSGNGGEIRIDDGNIMDLKQSSVTTSVDTALGNGGNITVSSPALVLDNGMIQANAYSGRGGDVFIQVDSLIGSQGKLYQGLAEPITWKDNVPNVPGFNVIQAASKFGLSGTVNVTSPQINLSGVLAGLSTSAFGRDLLSQDYCAIGVGSSLTVRGYGALPAKASDLLY